MPELDVLGQIVSPACRWSPEWRNRPQALRSLSERGLLRAIEGLAGGCAIPVTIDSPGDDLPEHIELAAYFIVSESLTNAGKYAGATAIRIRVERERGALLVEITDDGLRRRGRRGRHRTARAGRPDRRTRRTVRGPQPARRRDPGQREVAADRRRLTGSGEGGSPQRRYVRAVAEHGVTRGLVAGALALAALAAPARGARRGCPAVGRPLARRRGLPLRQRGVRPLDDRHARAAGVPLHDRPAGLPARAPA